MSRLSFGCPRSGDSMGIPHGVSHCGHEDIPGDGPTWGYPMCPMSPVSQYLGTSQHIPGMVPHGATLCVLCLQCPSTWGHPRTSQGMVPHGATLCVLCLKCPSTWGHPRTSQDIPGDGPTWGYPMCPMSQVSQYLGTSQDIPGMVPHGATLRVLCLKCPSTWGHPRTSRGWSHMGLPYVSYVSSVPVLGGHPRTSRGWSHMGLPYVSYVSSVPVLGGHPRTSRGWSHMGLPYVSYVSSVPVLVDIPGHPGDGPTWGYCTCPMSQVSQYLGTSQDIPRMVPHGATLRVLCLKCPSTWGHPRTSRGWSHMGLPYVSSVSSVPVLGDIPGHPVSHMGLLYVSYVSSVPVLGDIPGHPEDGATLRVLCLKCPSTWGHPRTSNVPHGATLCVLCLKCPSTWGHPRTSRGWSHMGLPYVSYVSSVPALGDIPGHPGDGPSWGYPGYILSCSLAETADEVITSAQY